MGWGTTALWWKNCATSINYSWNFVDKHDLLRIAKVLKHGKVSRMVSSTLFDDPPTTPPAFEAPVMSVSDLNAAVRSQLERRFPVLWVEGEIAQWDVRASGIFGKLKDLSEDSTMGFTIWSNAKTKETKCAPAYR